MPSCTHSPSFPAHIRRLSGVLLAVVFALGVALPAAAVPIAFSGTFDDPNPEEAGDPFSLTNEASPTSQGDITQVVFDLRTASTPPVTFDPATSPFTIVLEGGTGFATAVFSAGDTVLTLSFVDFQPGETFSFTVDVDDDGDNVNPSFIEGSTVTASFAVGGGSDLSAFMVNPPGPGADIIWSASANVPVPEPASLTLIGFGLIGLAWHGRRVRRTDRRR